MHGYFEMIKRSYGDEGVSAVKEPHSGIEFRELLKDAYYSGMNDKPKPRFKDLPHRSIYNNNSRRS